MLENNFLEKILRLKLPSRLEPLDLKHSQQKQLNVFLKRDDKIHPIVCGNKWRKLKYNLLKIKQQQSKEVISFGGCWSNHLHALGWCCHRLQIPLIAMVRGEPGRYKSAMISDLEKWDAEIHWLSREDYRLKNDKNWLQQLQDKFKQAVIIPEGGSNQLALQGVIELAKEAIEQSSQPIDYFCAAVGSGGTLAGLIKAFEATHTRVIGIPVLKGASDLEKRINHLLDSDGTNSQNWELVEGYEFGGYAKYNELLCSYVQEFYEQSQILLEPIYTAKLLWGIEDLIQKDFFRKGSNLVILHSGGLQGLRGINKFGLRDVTASN